MPTQGTNPDQSNQNWALCQMCGEKLLIHPETGETEQCAACRSRRSKLGLALGLSALLFCMIGVLMLLVLGVWVIL